MPILNLTEAREWCRIPHREDDPAIARAIEAAEAELERFTGISTRTRTHQQYVPEAPCDGFLMIERWPATAARIGATVVPLVTIGGLQQAQMPATATYPLTLDIDVVPSDDRMVRMLLLERVAELVSRRGDDTAAPAAGYWANAIASLAGGIG